MVIGAPAVTMFVESVVVCPEPWIVSDELAPVVVNGLLPEMMTLPPEPGELSVTGTLKV